MGGLWLIGRIARALGARRFFKGFSRRLKDGDVRTAGRRRGRQRTAKAGQRRRQRQNSGATTAEAGAKLAIWYGHDLWRFTPHGI